MNEKRFVVVDYETIKDTKTGEEFEWTLFVAFFNELAEENEQLRKQLKNRSAFIVDKGLADTFVRWKNE